MNSFWNPTHVIDSWTQSMTFFWGGVDSRKASRLQADQSMSLGSMNVKSLREDHP